jgi:predicted PurR-regulated permease PerM
MSIMNMPYTMLISVIVGVTNVIPFFGPYIGAIPSALIVLTVSPVKSVYFILMILLLQQFDGNVLGPKILGDSTGLSSFWVLFSIILFGGLMGVVGMIIGVPTFAVIYDLIKKLSNKLLKKKQLSTDTNRYEKLVSVAQTENGYEYRCREKKEEQEEQEKS